MSPQLQTLIGLMIPFVGTTLGASMVVFLKNEMSDRVRKVLLGFASGVMMAASVWSLLLPAIDKAKQMGSIPWLPAAGGFLAGMGFLLLLDTLIPHQHFDASEPEGLPSKARKNTMLLLAVTLHNIPEGMAIAAPLLMGGRRRIKAGMEILAVGLVTPLGFLLGKLAVSVLPHYFGFFMGLAGGVMLYLVVRQLWPEARRTKSRWRYIGGLLGITIILLATYI